MNQRVTDAIVLSRTSYGEADRILTVLTPDQGKIRLLAKGVRKVRSKLAGGIELFSVTSLTYIQGRGQLCTLVSSRLKTHYGKIVTDLDRTTFAYDVLKAINKITEDSPDAEYFELLTSILEALDDKTLPLSYVRLWFYVSLLKLGGHAPNLRHDTEGKQQEEAKGYMFSYDDMAFTPKNNGPFQIQHIKLLRVLLASSKPQVLQRVQGVEPLVDPLNQLLKTTLRHWHIA